MALNLTLNQTIYFWQEGCVYLQKIGGGGKKV